MTNMTIDEEIAETKAAISKVLCGGQNIKTRNGQVQLADLSQLRARLADLQAQKAIADSGGGGIFGTPLIYEGR